MITSSENVNHNLSKWFRGINIINAYGILDSIKEIIKTIDLGHRNIETGTTSKVEYVRIAS